MTTIVTNAPLLQKRVDSNPEFTNRRDDKQFDTAHKHSRRVKFLKKALPISAVSVVVIFIGSIFFSSTQFGNLSIESADFIDGKLVMKSPTMAGFDSRERPYDVKADRAIQDPKAPAVVSLEGINALVPVDDKSNARIIAAKGVYDSEKETMTLEDDILVTGARGMEIKLRSANIDMKSGSLLSSEPVSVRSNNTQISANSVQVRDNGNDILFQNRVRMTIQPSALRGSSAGQ